MNQPHLDKYQSGTILTVGSHNVRIIKYLTSGGFAQIYSCELQQPEEYLDSHIVCLKRVVVPDKNSLNTLRAEVEAMKLLRNNRHVVSYIDSHAAKSSMHNGTYEVFLLMEYCENGGLIDFMNTRLQNRLQEFEVLTIISQIAQGVAAMHALRPPLIHRDLKIENVLISKQKEYKVCDFGSVSGIIRPPTNPQEMAYVQHNIMKNTTAQYRAPEMIDLYRGLPIDEKSDIWALGVLLYKLCYYTTPFEKGGENAILYARYNFPAYPQYSENLKNLIRWMLLEQPIQRPNIYQLVERSSQMLGIPCPIMDFYSTNNQLQHTISMPQLNVLSHDATTASLLDWQAQSHAQAQAQAQQQLQAQLQIQQQQQQQVSLQQTQQPFLPAMSIPAGLREVKTTGGISLHDDFKSKVDNSYLDEVTQTADIPILGEKNSNSTAGSAIILSPVSTSSSDEKSPDEDKIIETINLPPRRRYNVPIENPGGASNLSSNDQDKISALENKIKAAIASSRKEMEQNQNALESPIVNEINMTFEVPKLKSAKPEKIIEKKIEPSLPKARNTDPSIPTVSISAESLKEITPELAISIPVVKFKEEDEPKKLTTEQKLKNEKTKELLRQKMMDKLNKSEKQLASKYKDTVNKETSSDKDITPKAFSKKPKPIVPPKPDRLKPKKPAKPAFLSGGKLTTNN